MASFKISMVTPSDRPGTKSEIGRRALELLGGRRPALLLGMDDNQLQAFFAGCRTERHRTPREVLRQDEPTDLCYLILKGRIEVSVMDVNGNRVLAHLAGQGEVLGEVEIFSNRPCAATCTTMPNTILAAFSASHVLSHMSPRKLLENFAGIFHDRLTRDNRQQSVAMFYPAEDRIRIHLLSLTTPSRPEAQMSQNSLALLAGCSRQTVNQTLAALRNEGIVEVTRGTIKVLDRARLQVPRPGADMGMLLQTMIPDDGE